MRRTNWTLHRLYGLLCLLACLLAPCFAVRVCRLDALLVRRNVSSPYTIDFELTIRIFTLQTGQVCFQVPRPPHSEVGRDHGSGVVENSDPQCDEVALRLEVKPTRPFHQSLATNHSNQVQWFSLPHDGG